MFFFFFFWEKNNWEFGKSAAGKGFGTDVLPNRPRVTPENIQTPHRRGPGSRERVRRRFSPFPPPHTASFPKHPRRCLRSGHGFPPFLGGTDTWRLRSVLPTPQEEVQGDQGPHDPTTQSTSVGKRGRDQEGMSRGHKDYGKI